MPVSALHLSTERTGTAVALSSPKASTISSIFVGGDELTLREQLAPTLGGELGSREAAGQARVHRAVLAVQRRLDVVLHAAVLLAHDHVLRDVHETTREVTRVGRTEGRVREALAGAVGGDEVLEHRQALHEVGLDRTLDDLALRVGHQASHARQLADLLERPSRSRVGHHEDRVQLVQVVLHGLANLVGGLRPLLDDGLVALLLRDQAAVVLILDLGHLSLVLLQDLLLLRRHHDVVLRDGDAGLGGEVEAQVLERVEHERDRVRAVQVHEVLDRLVHVALLERLVHEQLGVVPAVEGVAERPPRAPAPPCR